MSKTTRLLLITAVALGYSGFTLFVFIGSLRIGASVWEALLVTSSLLVAAILLVGFVAQLILTARVWLRKRSDPDRNRHDSLR